MSGAKPLYLSRDGDGNIKQAFDHVEGVSFQENPFEFLFVLSRYKFAARLLEKKAHVLDAGCGLGIGSVLLSKFSEKVTAVDFDQELIRNNRIQYQNIPNLSFEPCDLTQLPTGHPTYDAVVSLDVIEHFPKEAIPAVVENLSRLTADHGFAVIGTPNIASQPFASKRRLDSHFHEFAPEELKDLLKGYFKNVFVFSMTDENVSLNFPKMAWYLMALCTK